ncbi:MAG TPA: flavin reductase family protein, partial [Bacillota bacterium]
MDIRFDALEPRTRYKLMTGTIVPRPIAWVNTLNPDGGCNTAPFSFFNGVSDEPPTLMFCVGKRPDGSGDKDTLVNIRRHGEFVVHLCDEDTIEALSFTAGDFPPGVEELTEYGGLTLVPSATISVPRIAEAPVAYECRLLRLVDLEGTYTMVIGRIESLYVRDDL